MGSVWNEEKHGSRQQATALEGTVFSDLDALASNSHQVQQRLRRNAPIRAMGRAAAEGLARLLAGDANDDTVRAWIADLDAMVLKEAKQPDSGPALLS